MDLEAVDSNSVWGITIASVVQSVIYLMTAVFTPYILLAPAKL